MLTDEQAAEMGLMRPRTGEEQRSAEQEQLIAEINRLFGLYDEAGRPSMTDPEYFNRVTERDRDRAGPGVLGKYRPYNAVGKRTSNNFDQNAYDQGVAEWEALQAQYRREAEANLASRNELYGTVNTDIINLLSEDLNQQRTDAEREERFRLARQGLLGGSANIDTFDRILNEYGKASAGIADQAGRATTDLRMADEQSRLNLIDRVLAGENASAVLDRAATQLQQSAQDAVRQADINGMGSIFSTAADVNRYRYNQNQLGNTQQSQNSPAYYSPSNYQGNVQ